MALNPPINHEGQPMRVEGEYFAVLRKDIEIEVKIEGWAKLTGKGKLFVTTARLVFVNGKHATDSFKSFDIPLLNIYDEKFEQPIFGANYLSLKVKPLFNLIPGDAKVKLWFMSGGCQKFLDIFLNILPQIRKRKNEGADPNFVRDLTSGKLNSKYAYVDPSDPSYVFVTQPQPEQSNSQMNAYYSKFPEAQPGVNYAPPASELTQATPSNQQTSTSPPLGSQGQIQQPSTFSGQGVVIGTGAPIQSQGQASYPQFDQGAYAQTGQAYQYDPNTQPQSQNPYQYQPQSQNQYQYQPQPQNQIYQGPQSNMQQGMQQIQPENIQQPQNVQQQQQQRPNVGYYYGYWGPQLKRNY